MNREVEAFIARWMRENGHILEEIVHLQADDPSTPYGAAMAACLNSAEEWPPSRRQACNAVATATASRKVKPAQEPARSAWREAASSGRRRPKGARQASRP